MLRTYSDPSGSLWLEKTVGNEDKIFHRKAEASLSATAVFSEIPSEPKRVGRRLTLKFLSLEVPELDRIEFQAGRDSQVLLRQRGDLDDVSQSFKRSAASQALSIFVLDHLCAQLKQPPKKYILEGADDSLASSLGYALDNGNGKWGSLFREVTPRLTANRISKMFGGHNFGGKPDKQRVIYLNPDWLPADCIEIYWNDQPLKGLAEIQRLTDQFRLAWELPPPKELDIPIPKPPEPARPPEPKQPKPEVQRAELEPKAKLPPKKKIQKRKTAKPLPGPIEPEPTPTPPQPTPPQPTPPELVPPSPAPLSRPKLLLPIPAHLFEIQNPAGLEWNDYDPLINFGSEDSEADVWRIKDASEGLLIFGSVGSGKTSASGSAAANAFLQAGYGGLVLTAKPDEAARWIRLCQRNGRAADCVHIAPGSGHKLNIFHYETMRPGRRLSITDDLIELFRSVLGVSTGSKEKDRKDDFWTTAPNRLMGRLFDLFLLAHEPITLDALILFVESAPTKPSQPWQKIEYFSDIINRAQENADRGDDGDREDFQKALHYWTQAYPAITEITRSGILAGFTAMADMLNSRGIKETIGSQTNITPEQILSGKIVILDFPLKEGSRSGLMVQAAWKLLFQQAIERRADKGLPTARPVFLWEDEGHLFFSQYDINFQPTARDCRAAHVILSQNFPNFTARGHSRSSILSVFSAMNTCIFHSNVDIDTNRWASDRIGEETTQKIRADRLWRNVSPDEISIFSNDPEDVESIGSFSLTEETKKAVRPEEFSQLKKPEGGICEAIMLWLSHEFEINGGKNYCRLKFAQEPR